MKDSGVEPMGGVPKHWEVRQLRHVAELRVSNVDKHTTDGELSVRLCNYVDVYKHDRIRTNLPFMAATATAEEIERFRIEIGDVLLTKDSESWTDIGVPALVVETAPDLICAYHLAILRPSEDRLLPGYLFHAIQSNVVAYQFHVGANGVTRYGLSHAAIKSVRLPVPPVPEQNAIVRFLDHADRRIRRYIRAKQELIELLKDQERVIIHEIVTGGIDPDVPMKDSGIPWIGTIPAHWDVRRNGLLFAQRNETGHPELPILQVSLRTGVTVRDFDDPAARKQVMADRAKYKRAVHGDIAYNMMRMWQGAVGVAPVDGLVSPAYVVARPLRGVETRYYEHWFRDPAFLDAADIYSRGIVKDRNRLYWDRFKAIASPVPPLAEQHEIVCEIGRATTRLRSVSHAARREIDLLCEYRERLVADVVTGKLDVRDAAAGLPAELEPFDEDAERDLDEGEGDLDPEMEAVET